MKYAPVARIASGVTPGTRNATELKLLRKLHQTIAKITHGF